MAVTMPLADVMAVATAPTTPWSGAVCSRMVMEYDGGVADMLLTLVGGGVRPGAASAPAQHPDEEHEGDQLRAGDHGDERSPLHLVEPPGEDAAQERGRRLERRERAVRRGQASHR